jgi:hypothetical protein
MRFEHLEFANQTYFEHFKDSMYFSFKALKASFCFFIHACYPNSFERTGSNEIFDLNETIKSKYSNTNISIFN